jgi:plastocyanin
VRKLFLAASLLFLAAVAGADQTVNVGPGIAFNPSTVTIVPGETITWVWMGSPHSSTSNATSGPEFWDSGILSTGASFSHTFITPGSYPYYCKVHSTPTGTSMNGVVQVVPPTVTPTPLPATPTVTPLPATPPPGPAPSGPIPMLDRKAEGLLAIGLISVALLLLLAARRQ